jgi:5-methylcytosine-specific restriction endonuclease McrA
VKCASYKRLCIDHKYPYSLGGSDEPDNLQTLCWECNSKKSNKIEAPNE